MKYAAHPIATLVVILIAADVDVRLDIFKAPARWIEHATIVEQDPSVIVGQRASISPVPVFVDPAFVFAVNLVTAYESVSGMGNQRTLAVPFVGRYLGLYFEILDGEVFRLHDDYSSLYG